jgi:hypothetical protein
MDILITDVTEMGANVYCVAGWCEAQGRMVRPLPNGGNWGGGLLNSRGVAPEVTLRVAPTGVAHGGAYPHSSEDTRIDPATAVVVDHGPTNWFGAGAPPLAATLQDAFEGNVQHSSIWDGRRQGVYVPLGTQTRSLWGVGVNRDHLQFVEDFGKLKAHLNDGDHTYKISVSSRVLKEAFRNGGIAAVNASLPANGGLHVRVGLARAWPPNHPTQCYTMINGVHW